MTPMPDRPARPFVLCFAQGAFIYFTNQPLATQTGDDWGDAPFEDNAGTPHEDNADPPTWAIRVYGWRGPFDLPCADDGTMSYSVDQINRREVPWLANRRWSPGDPLGIVSTKTCIWAGMAEQEVFDLIRGDGGTIYAPLAPVSGA